jgi:Tfp pilus assembly PilM family ATPase
MALLNASRKDEVATASSTVPGILPGMDELFSKPTTCPACGHVNAAGRRFCTKCGKHLWIDCPQCNTPCAVLETYCGGCGAKVANVGQELVDRFETRLADYQRLQRECRFDEANLVLGQLVSNKHQILAERVAEVRRMAEEGQTYRQEQITRAHAAGQEAADAMAAFDYERVCRVAEGVPEAIRGEAMSGLLREAQSRLQEIAELEAKVSAAIASGQTQRSLPAVQRLLSLKPHHVEVLQLARQFARQLLPLAQKRVATHQYAEALKLLRAIPESARDPDAKILLERCEEIEWLLDEIRCSPVIDGILPAIVKRLRQLAPEYPNAAKFAEEVEKRLAAAVNHPKMPIPTWAKKTATPDGNPAVDWLVTLRHINAAAIRDLPVFREHPGAFFVACGLALQGLGQAPYPTNLLPSADMGVLGRVAKMVPRRAARSAWGIDLGSSALKAVRLAFDGAKGPILLSHCVHIEYRKLLSQAADDAETLRLIEDAVRGFLGAHYLKADRVCLGLPGLHVAHSAIGLPPMPADKIDAAVMHESRRRYEAFRKDLVSAYHLLERPEGEADEFHSQEVLLVAARLSRLQALRDCIQKTGLNVDTMQSDCMALHNFLAYEHHRSAGSPDSEKVETAVALIDVGSVATNVIVSSPRTAWIHSLGGGAEQFTRCLVQELDIGFTVAEEVKRQHADLDRLYPTYKALEPTLSGLAEEIERALAVFASTHPTQKISHLFGVGGGFQTHGLFAALRAELS